MSQFLLSPPLLLVSFDEGLVRIVGTVASPINAMCHVTYAAGDDALLTGIR